MAQFLPNQSSPTKSVVGSASASAFVQSDALPEIGITNPQTTREVFESLAVAFILALMFKAFIADAFVIPTGSMAPTLMGAHKDVHCSECGYQYQSGASQEFDNATQTKNGNELRASICPMCRKVEELDPKKDRNQSTFSGDRILVSKLAYALGKPNRWQVIVFKFVEEAKLNYIKRCVGLPGESIRIKQGDIFVKKTDQPEDQFEIARKPPHVLLAMLQPVSDTKHQPRPITEGIVPDPWQPEALSSESQSNIPNWNRPSSQEGTGKGKGWSATVSKVPAGQLAMLRYRHRVMTPEVLQQLEASPNNPRNAESQKKIKDPNSYRLISDFTWYNHSRWMSPNFATPRLEYDGTFWVGDLAGEWDFKTEPGSEALHLLLVEGGVEFRCVIDLKTGIAAATAEFEGAKIAPFATGRERANQIEAKTSVRAGSRHRIRFANIDDALTLWVDGKVVPWATSGAYNIELAVPGYKHLPVVKESDPMDAAPLGIGVVGGGCSLERAQVFRDIYYIAPGVNEDTMLRSDYQGVNRAQTLAFQDWPTYDLGPDDYFPMGDNSRASSDARLWKSNSQPGRLMIGRALMVFWPHYWYLWNRIRPIPNFSKFRFIR